MEGSEMKKVRFTRVDDIDGGNGSVNTVTFSYQGRMYEIDLSAQNQLKFESALKKYVSHARVKSGTRRKSSTVNAHKMRVWAVDQGIDVGSRGRVPKSVIAEYKKAN